MRLSLAFFSMLFMFNVYADNQYQKAVQPSDVEIQQNRACFHDLEVQGCRTQDEDPEQFRSCLSNAVDSLDDHCKEMMLKLYGE